MNKTKADDLTESGNALIHAVRNRDDDGFHLLWEELGDRQESVAFYLARLVLKALGHDHDNEPE